MVIAIDDRSLSDTTGLGRWQDYRREYYAKVIDRLKKDGAIVIGLDILFSEKSSTSGDDLLTKSIRNAGNVVLGFSRGQALFPIPSFSEASAAQGFFDPIVNPVNSNVYSIHPVGKVSGKLYESFSFAILRKYLDAAYGKKTSPTSDRRAYEKYYEFYEGEYQYVPYASDVEDNQFLINYLPLAYKFPQMSFSDVYKAEISGKNGEYRPEWVKDKIVIIGATATGLHDEFFTPMGILSGAFVHANAINTVLNRAYISNVSGNIELLVLFLTTFFFALFLLHVGSRAYQMLVSGIVLVLASALGVVIFSIFRKQLNYPVEFLLAGVFVSLGSTGYKYMLEEKGKRLLKNALSQYLAEDIVASVLSDFDKVKLGGDRKNVTLFFSDIAGFTTLSEKMEPEELVRFLSIYLKEASDIIMKEKGFINKYEGDAIMAIWGAFKEQPDQTLLACVSALEQQEKILELNERFQHEFGFGIEVRMGINEGPAVVGNIGSEGKKIEFTALGDTVNIASRFEGINKLYGTLICVGESVKESAKSHFVFRRLDSIMVKGKDKPTAIYELVGRIGEVSE